MSRGTQKELLAPPTEEPELVAIPSPTCRRGFMDVKSYKGLKSPPEIFDLLLSGHFHEISEEQLDLFLLVNPELAKFADASNILTKRAVVKSFASKKLGDEFVKYPLCSNLCGLVPDVFGLCGHARCSKCQPEGAPCIICKVAPSARNITVAWRPTKLKPYKTQPKSNKWIEMGSQGCLVINCLMYVKSEVEAKIISDKATHLLTHRQAYDFLGRNKIYEELAETEKSAAVLLTDDVLEQRCGYPCMGCGEFGRVFLLDCQHIYHCKQCLVDVDNELYCPACNTLIESGYLPLKHDLIPLK